MSDKMTLSQMRAMIAMHRKMAKAYFDAGNYDNSNAANAKADLLQKEYDKSELESKLAELAKEFTISGRGTITNPGKFEGESLAAPYYYGLYMDGGDTIFEVAGDERAAFGWDEDENFVYLEETNDGFIYVCLFRTMDEAEDYQRKCELMDDDF